MVCVTRYAPRRRAAIAGKGFREKYPRVGAVSRTGSFDRDRNAVEPAGVGESNDVAPPLPLVEVRGEKPAVVARQHRIDAHDERSAV